MADGTTIRPEFLIRDGQELRDLYGPVHAVAAKKCLDHLDRHAVEFVGRSPFLCIGTQSPGGTADVSPRGDPRGFVKIPDDRTLLIPDRPGNNRLDTQINILANPAVGLLFMVPGFDDTLRVNGRAVITRDPDLLKLLAMNGREPTVAIVVTVAEVFMHCAKAFRRSRLWDPAEHQDRRAMASLPQIIHDQTSGEPVGPEEIRKRDAELEDEYRRTMY